MVGQTYKLLSLWMSILWHPCYVEFVFKPINRDPKKEHAVICAKKSLKSRIQDLGKSGIKTIYENLI